MRHSDLAFGLERSRHAEGLHSRTVKRKKKTSLLLQAVAESRGWRDTNPAQVQPPCAHLLRRHH
jgi:hypothetical protein